MGVLPVRKGVQKNETSSSNRPRPESKMRTGVGHTPKSDRKMEWLNEWNARKIRRTIERGRWWEIPRPILDALVAKGEYVFVDGMFMKKQ
jgi:hypothetical protein